MSSKQIFEKFDKNQNGELSLDEFREAVLAFFTNISQEDISKMFEEIDLDSDDKLSYDEFTSWADQMLKDAFDLCDADGDGKISSSEFHAAVTGLGKDFSEEKCAEMVRAADTDGDGYVSFEEFMVMIIDEF